MKHRLLTTGCLAAFVVAGLLATQPAGGQVVRRDTTSRAVQRPATRVASVDSLVECSPVAAPVKKKPVVRHRRRIAPVKPAVAAAIVPKPAPKPIPKPTKLAVRRRPLVHRVRRVTPRSSPRATPAAARSTTIVMCRPVRPIAPLAEGTPTEKSVIPVPQLASATPAPPEVGAGPPLFVFTTPGMPIVAAGGHSSWLPFAVVPAIFFPFIHTGTTHRGSTPSDSTHGPPVTPPDTTPTTTPLGPPDFPPTTTPEPGTFVMLGSGLLGLGGVLKRKRKL